MIQRNKNRLEFVIFPLLKLGEGEVFGFERDFSLWLK